VKSEGSQCRLQKILGENNNFVRSLKLIMIMPVFCLLLRPSMDYLVKAVLLCRECCVCVYIDILRYAKECTYVDNMHTQVIIRRHKRC